MSSKSPTPFCVPIGPIIMPCMPISAELTLSVRAPFLLSQLAIRLHLATATSHPDRQLSIINMASIAAHRSASLASVYGMSKHALVGLTKNVAVEYAQQGVRCNSISPVSLHP